MNRKKTTIMLTTTALILSTIAIIDKFAETFISNILPYITIVAIVTVIIEAIIAFKVVKSEYKED